MARCAFWLLPVSADLIVGVGIRRASGIPYRPVPHVVPPLSLFLSFSLSVSVYLSLFLSLSLVVHEDVGLSDRTSGHLQRDFSKRLTRSDV